MEAHVAPSESESSEDPDAGEPGAPDNHSSVDPSSPIVGVESASGSDAQEELEVPLELESSPGSPGEDVVVEDDDDEDVESPSEGVAADGPDPPDTTVPSTADEERIHSVHVVLPEGWGGIPIDLVLNESVQMRVHDTCRRFVPSDLFRRLWPRGRRDFLDSLFRGLEEAGRGPVAHGLSRQQAQGLTHRLTEFVAAEVAVDREAAELVHSATGQSGAGQERSGSAAGSGGPNGTNQASDDTRIYSVYFIVAPELQAMLDLILPEYMPRIIEVCRRHREFPASWPGGASEMEQALRSGAEESGRGPLLHGLTMPQAEALRTQLGEFFEVQVAEDRPAAARIRERERRNRPPAQPPPHSLVCRCSPGSRATVTASSPESLERAQKGVGGLGPNGKDCYNKQGTVVGYCQSEGSNSWLVKLRIVLDSGDCVHDWNPTLLQTHKESNDAVAKSDSDDGEVPLFDEDDEDDDDEEDDEDPDVQMHVRSERWPLGEVMLINDEEFRVDDSVIFHSDGQWLCGTITAVGEEEVFDITAEMGNTETGVSKRHIHRVIFLQATPPGLYDGALVRVTNDACKARALQRNLWTESSERCLGQLGMVVDVKDRRRMVVICPAASDALTWNVGCLEVHSSNGLRCLDLHAHPLWWCTNLDNKRSCAGGCGAEELSEGYCCLRMAQCTEFALCKECAAPYIDEGSKSSIRTRHHLCPLTRIALPRGPKESRCPCFGQLCPAGCRSEANGKDGSKVAAYCVDCSFLICGACLADEELGETNERTRQLDVEALPVSAPRIQAALRAHPSELFALSEAGLFTTLAHCLKPYAGDSAPSNDDQELEENAGDGENDDKNADLTVRNNLDSSDARNLALEIGAWLAKPAPERVRAGPVLVEVHDGHWVEATSVAEHPCCLDGEWTDEAEPGRMVRILSGNLLYPPVVSAEPERYDLEVSGCGMAEFNGRYIPNGTKNSRTKYVKVGIGSAQTINYSAGSWYLCHNYEGSWYQAVGDTEVPPPTGWCVGSRGQSPPPASVENLQNQSASNAFLATYAVRGATSRVLGSTALSPAQFGMLPSVGSWLMPVFSEVGDANCDCAETDENSKSQASPDADVTKIERISKDAFCIEMNGAWRCAQLTGDGRLAWADGGSTWIRLERCPSCPQGHVLRRGRHTAPWNCGECDEKRSERLRLRCVLCEYNFCRSCLAVRGWLRTSQADTLENEFQPGTEAEVRNLSASSRSDEWQRCTVQGPGTKKGTCNVTLRPKPNTGTAEQEELASLLNVAPAHIRCPNLRPVHGPIDALWRYASPNDIAIGIRSVPEIDGPRDGQLEHGQVFRVSEHREGVAGILFLRLADNRGWVFDRKPGVGTMCVLLRQRPASAGGITNDVADNCCAVAWSSREDAPEDHVQLMSKVVGGDKDSCQPSAAPSVAGCLSAVRPETAWVHLSRLRPAIDAEDSDRATDFLRAELNRELRRGPKCMRSHVRGVLEGKVNVLAVDGGEDLLHLAFRSKCNTEIIEALLTSFAPIVASSIALLPGKSSDDSSNNDERQQPIIAFSVQAVLDMCEPRLASLIAERSSTMAANAADSMTALANICENAENADEESGMKEFVAALDVAGRETLAASARICAAAARRHSQVKRPIGRLPSLLSEFGQKLLTPLLKAKDMGVSLFEPGGRLGGLLEALGSAGFEPTTDQADYLASVIAAKMAEEPDGCSHGWGFLGPLGVILSSFSRGVGEDAIASAALRTALWRHGVVASVERISESSSPVLSRRSADACSTRAIAEGLSRCLRGSREVAANASPAEQILNKLPDVGALQAVIAMLRDGSCTSYELGVYDAAKKMLPAFEPPGGAWPWPATSSLDSSSLALLVTKLQALLGLSETFPMAALSVRGEGLSCVLQPHVLALDGPGGSRELRVEPLLPLSDLESFLLLTTPIDDPAYLEWCANLKGKRIAECPTSLGCACVPWKTARVINFSLRHQYPVHDIRYECDGAESHVLLHLRRVVVLEQDLAADSSTTVVDEEPPPDSTPDENAVLLTPGNKVLARFEDGSWCRATVAQDNGDNTCTIRWENGTMNDLVKGLEHLRPLPGKPMCQRVQITQEGVSAVGVAVWEHASGHQDVIDQAGRFLDSLPKGSVIPETRHARQTPDRPMPFEIRNLSMSERIAPSAVPSLERIFSAVDRNYRPRDFQYKNPARKIGGPEGEPLLGPDPVDGSPSKVTLDLEIKVGTPAPRLHVQFFTQTLNEEAAGESSKRPVPGQKPPNPSRNMPNRDSESTTPISDSSPSSPGHHVPGHQVPSTSTVLQALVRFEQGGRAELPERLRLRYEIHVRMEGKGLGSGNSSSLPMVGASSSTIDFATQSAETAAATEAAVGSGGAAAPVLALLRHLRRQWKDATGKVPPGSLQEVSWESTRLNKKCKDLLAQPLLTAAVAAPPWVLVLPLMYPFLFSRKVREQLLRCTAFGTSHAILWLQQQWIEERYGDRLRRVEGQLEGRMDLTEHIVSDSRVFIGPARSDFTTLPSRENLLASAERVVELTYKSKSMLEVKFADEGGFGDGVTQSFYTAVVTELCATDEAGSAPLSGPFGMWAEHLPESVVEHHGRVFLHSRRGLFPRPRFPGSPESENVCRRFRFLGRLMTKALRDGFVVPIPLCEHFFAAVLGEDLPLSALPSPGDGFAGEFVGAAGAFAAELRQQTAGLPKEAIQSARREATTKPGWGQEYLKSTDGEAKDWSFDQYAKACGVTFCETGLGGPELCDGGSSRPVDADSLDEFVENAAYWWLREGIAPQVSAFRDGVEDVCASSAIWAFEASELSALFCGGHVEWSKEQLQQHLRPKGGLEAREIEMLVDVLDGLSPNRRGQFLEFVTACPRLPPRGLASAEITVSPAQPAGSLPRARTCTKELRLPKYKDRKEMEQRLIWAMDNAQGVYDDDRML